MDQTQGIKLFDSVGSSWITPGRWKAAAQASAAKCNLESEKKVQDFRPVG